MDLVTVAAKTIVVHIAILHFVGLTFFTAPPASESTKTLDDTEFVAIMPFVPSHVSAGATDPTIATSATSPQRMKTHTARLDDSVAGGSQPLTPSATHSLLFDPHVALIIFKDKDLLDVSGWSVKRLESGFLSIELTGEHLTFAGYLPNQNVSRSLSLGRVTGSTQLRPEYMAPAYSDAAAVFKIPNTDIAACASQPIDPAKPFPFLVRVDTEVTLRNSGQLIIKSGAKSLTVIGNAVVTFANTPLPFADHQATATNGVPHNGVYCTMTTGSAPCDVAFPSQQDMTLHPIGRCHDATMVMEGGTVARFPAVPHRIDSLVDFACSNTQWP
jgi:hypothetical protein